MPPETACRTRREEPTLASQAPADEHPPIQCLLELHYDGTLAIVARRGCTDQDIHDMFRQFTDAVWPYQASATVNALPA